MRRLAIASLVLPILGMLALSTFVALPDAAIRFPFSNPYSGSIFLVSTDPVIASVWHASYYILLFGSALGGLGLALFVLFAPAFRRQRAGVIWAAMGLCASTLLLFVLWALGFVLFVIRGEF